MQQCKLCKTLRSSLNATVGTWLSLVEHSLGVRGVGSSNLPVPTNSDQLLTNFYFGKSALIVGEFVGTLNRAPRLRSLAVYFDRLDGITLCLRADVAVTLQHHPAQVPAIARIAESEVCVSDEAVSK